MQPYYSADGITLYHGDCRDVLASLEARTAAALVTDPPYGTEDLGGGYGRRQLTGTRYGHRIANDGDITTWAESLPLARRVLAADAWACAFCAPRKRHDAGSALLAAGFALVGEVVWDKGRPGLGYTVRYSHETALIASVGEPRPVAPVLSLIHASVPTHAIAGRHPHEKPVAALAHLIAFAAPPGALVLDPFAGSGTTLRAAKDLGRRAIGIELEERWCEVAALRLEQGVLNLGGVA